MPVTLNPPLSGEGFARILLKLSQRLNTAHYAHDRRLKNLSATIKDSVTFGALHGVAV